MQILVHKIKSAHNLENEGASIAQAKTNANSIKA